MRRVAGGPQCDSVSSHWPLDVHEWLLEILGRLTVRERRKGDASCTGFTDKCIVVIDICRARSRKGSVGSMPFFVSLIVCVCLFYAEIWKEPAGHFKQTSLYQKQTVFAHSVTLSHTPDTARVR